VLELLDAAHIGPKKEHGSDDPRNGLVLCPNHHRAFDIGFCAVHPENLEIQCKEGGPSAEALQIANASLAHLRRKPHKEALEWRWQRWKQKANAGEHS
jgi:predicted restriction endonuclease